MPNQDTLEKKVDKILGYLHNDEGTGTKGLVADFADHKKKFNEFVTKYENEQSIKKRDHFWISGIFGAVGTAVTFIGKYLLDKFSGGHHG